MRGYVFIYVVIVGCFIGDVTYAQQWEGVTVDRMHAWVVTFNERVDHTSFQQHVTIVNDQQQSLPLTVVAISETSIRISPPTLGYEAGRTYTLTIPKTVTSSTGTGLHEEVVMTFTAEPHAPKSEVYLTEQETALAIQINRYRLSLGLHALPISKSLTVVARTHVADSNAHAPENAVDARGETCNLHSWSTYGNWTAVCYTKDHLYAEALWSKPRELTTYTGSGYEISIMVSRHLTPQLAVALWRESPAHEAIIASRGAWAVLTTMGVAIDGKYAHVWFGSEEDPAGYVQLND